MSLLVGAMNMELVVIPLILKGWLGFAGWDLKITTCVWATSEIFYWYWFAGWLKKEIKTREKKKIKEAIDDAQSIGQDAIEELKNSGILNRIDWWIKQYIIDPFSPENYTNRKTFLFLVGSGYVVGLPILLFLGAMPVLWIVGFVFCKFVNWKAGFAAIVFGNLLKSIFFAESWDLLWTLF